MIEYERSVVNLLSDTADKKGQTPAVRNGTDRGEAVDMISRAES